MHSPATLPLLLALAAVLHAQEAPKGNAAEATAAAPRLERASQEFAQEREGARAGVLAAFEQQKRRIRAHPTMKAEAKASHIAVLELDEQEFVAVPNRMPQCEAMSKAAAAYEKAVLAARRRYRGAVKTLAAELDRSQQALESERLLQVLSQDCPPLIEPPQFAARMDKPLKELSRVVPSHLLTQTELRKQIESLVHHAATHRITIEDLATGIVTVRREIVATPLYQNPAPKYPEVKHALQQIVSVLDVLTRNAG